MPDLSHVFESVAKRVIITALKPALGTLSLARFDQVLEATRALNGWLAAFSAAFVSLHPQLIFPLAGDRQLRKFILNSLSHGRLLCLLTFKAESGCLTSPYIN